MKNLLFVGVMASLAFATAPVMAASDSFAPAFEKLTAKEFGGVYEGRRGGNPMPGSVMGGGHGPRPVIGGGHGPRPMPVMGGHHGPRPHVGHNNPRWGSRVNGRWFAGFSAPGGWSGYRVPFRGYALPSYWINPSYSIGNYSTYGLYAPMTGYGWSRYYDDAVLRDSRGYVQDYRSGIDWNRYEGGYAPSSGYAPAPSYTPAQNYAPAGGYRQPEYAPAMTPDRQVYDVNGSYDADDREDDSDVEYREGTGAPYAAPAAQGGYYSSQRAPAYAPPAPAYSVPSGYERYERCLKDRGVGGGAIGAVIGAVAGNRIAGRGDRLAGSLIGGGLGALAGVGIEKATNKCQRYLPSQSSYPAPGPQYYPAPQSAPPVYAPQQPYPQQGYPQQAYPQQQGGGYYQNGYYYPAQPAPTVTTVTVTPAVMTTTTVTEETYYETVSVRRPAVRKYRAKPRAKPKPRCHCH